MFSSFKEEPDKLITQIQNLNQTLNQVLPESININEEEFTVIPREANDREELKPYSTSSTENIEFHKLFNLPETEILVQCKKKKLERICSFQLNNCFLDYGCTLVSTFFVQGWIYITRNFLCFCSNQYISFKRIVIPIK